MHVGRCEVFLQVRQQKDEKLDVLRRAVLGVSDNILGADENAIAHLRTAFESLLQSGLTQQFKALMEEVVGLNV